MSPARSKAQRNLMALARHAPEKVHPENRGVLLMSLSQLADFARTPERGLPRHVKKRSGHQ